MVDLCYDYIVAVYDISQRDAIFSRSRSSEINATLTQSVKPSGSRLPLFRHGYTGDPDVETLLEV